MPKFLNFAMLTVVELQTTCMYIYYSVLSIAFTSGNYPW
jgi:hypothetical protein